MTETYTKLYIEVKEKYIHHYYQALIDTQRHNFCQEFSLILERIDMYILKIKFGQEILLLASSVARRPVARTCHS